MNLNHKRIVVTFLMHLGDVILTTPFFNMCCDRRHLKATLHL